MSKSMSPIRTCVVCRQKSEKSAMLRIVTGSGLAVSELDSDTGSLVVGHLMVSFDPMQELPGRGCYVHASPRCLQSERLWSQIKQRLCRGTGSSRKGRKSVDVEKGKCRSKKSNSRTSDKQVTGGVTAADGRGESRDVNEAKLRTSSSGGIARQVNTCFDPAGELEKALNCAKRGIAAKKKASRKEQVAVAMYAKLRAQISGDICSVKVGSSTSEHLSSRNKQRIKNQRIKLIL